MILRFSLGVNKIIKLKSISEGQHRLCGQLSLGDEEGSSDNSSG